MSLIDRHVRSPGRPAWEEARHDAVLRPPGTPHDLCGALHAPPQLALGPPLPDGAGNDRGDAGTDLIPGHAVPPDTTPTTDTPEPPAAPACPPFPP